MTPSGIEPATFRFVAQYLNHCATISGPLWAFMASSRVNFTFALTVFSYIYDYLH
jgi:hypothetical protein